MDWLRASLRIDRLAGFNWQPLRTVELGSDKSVSRYPHIAADSARATQITPERTAHYKNLVAETGVLFGSRHYRGYHFLLTLSDHVPACRMSSCTRAMESTAVPVV